jgi:AcrR family transcriptional regulator
MSTADARRGGAQGPKLAALRPRPRLTREQIIVSALAIADAEGVEALSMRRLADELGAGTMSLYRHVRNKSELFALMKDAIVADLLVSDEAIPSEWRPAVMELAERLRAVLDKRPWAVASLPSAYVGPSGMRAFEQALAALANAPLGPEEKLEFVAIVHQYVLGFILYSKGAEAAGEEWVDDVAHFMSTQLATGAFPHIQQLVGEAGASDFLRRPQVRNPRPGSFERGLRLLLDGVEAPTS